MTFVLYTIRCDGTEPRERVNVSLCTLQYSSESRQRNLLFKRLFITTGILKQHIYRELRQANIVSSQREAQVHFRPLDVHTKFSLHLCIYYIDDFKWTLSCIAIQNHCNGVDFPAILYLQIKSYGNKIYRRSPQLSPARSYLQS